MLPQALPREGNFGASGLRYTSLTPPRGLLSVAFRIGRCWCADCFRRCRRPWYVSRANLSTIFNARSQRRFLVDRRQTGINWRAASVDRPIRSIWLVIIQILLKVNLAETKPEPMPGWINPNHP